MPCYKPLPAWKCVDRSTGEIFMSFRPSLCSIEKVKVPCGQCIGCRIQRSRSWAVRCLHEASLYEQNCFITLTYAPEHLPDGLVKRDLQLFFKRLRSASKRKFRYFAVGEYGEKLSRPHYHCLLFGFDFEDKKFWKGSGEYRQYRSELLEKCWPLGNALTGSVTTASAQYVAKYCVKMVRGEGAIKHYGDREREFAVMSRRPGIGAEWIDKYQSDVFPRDFVVVVGGRKVGVPRYYLDRQKDSELRERVKAQRVEKAEDNPHNSVMRLYAREKLESIKLEKSNLRRIEDEAASLRGI